jgi:hypothetical protein
LQNEYGRLRDVVEGPTARFYVATSNRDQYGKARPMYDRILRLTPLCKAIRLSIRVTCRLFFSATFDARAI